MMLNTTSNDKSGRQVMRLSQTVTTSAHALLRSMTLIKTDIELHFVAHHRDFCIYGLFGKIVRKFYQIY